MTPTAELVKSLRSLLSCEPNWSAAESELAARLVENLSSPPMERLQSDPATIMAMAMPGKPADPWQQRILRSLAKRMLFLCSRQAGKSTVAAALAIKAALLEAPALILLLSPTQRQSGELFRSAVLPIYAGLGKPVEVTQETALTMTLANGSRIISLPGSEENIRGFSGVKLIIIDEAARVPDDLYRAVRPMLAVSNGALVCLSTPFGKRGWFYSEWSGKAAWERVRITAEQCPRITKEFLEEEERALGERWYKQEYLCSFEETIDSVFSASDIEAAMDDDLEPLVFGDLS